jgi:hypothetical protein
MGMKLHDAISPQSIAPESPGDSMECAEHKTSDGEPNLKGLREFDRPIMASLIYGAVAALLRYAAHLRKTVSN